MIAENDHVRGNLIGSCKDESKPHQCSEENWENTKLKIPENGKNNNNSCELFYDTRSRDEWDKESVGNIMDSHSSGGSNGAENKIRDTSHDLAADGDSPKKVDLVFYMDKKVTVCDLPEIVVCFKEDSYHVVKDICVDEGVPVQEKFLFGEKDSVKCSANSNQCGSEDLKNTDKTDVNSSETKSSEDSHSNADKTDLNSSETKSSEESHSKVDESEFCNGHKTDKEVEESSKEDFSDAEGSSNYNQESLNVTEEVKDSPPQTSYQSEICTEIKSEENLIDEVAISSEDVLNETLTLGDILSREDKQKSLNHNNISNRSEEQFPQLQDKETGSLGETEPPETGLEKTEEPKTDEEKLTTTSQEPNKTCKDPEKPESENHEQKCLVENTSEEDKLLSSRFGETSFSAAESVSISGHITYSGPIAFSGSLSVRSDASTTSGRSFAFPILQSEWNSSPVRMAKADKRRQKGGWRHILLCCRYS